MSENDTIQKKSKSQINKAVFFTSALLIFLLVAFAADFYMENVLVVWLTGWAEWREYDEDNKKRLL